jgi:hypothetical protein
MTHPISHTPRRAHEALNNLGTVIRRAPCTCRKTGLSRTKRGRKAQIEKLEMEGTRMDEDVFRLDIAVTDAQGRRVEGMLDYVEQLFEDDAGFTGVQVLFDYCLQGHVAFQILLCGVSRGLSEAERA